MLITSVPLTGTGAVSLAGTDCDLNTNVPELVQEPMTSQQAKSFVKVAGIVYYFETAVVRQGT